MTEEEEERKHLVAIADNYDDVVDYLDNRTDDDD